jgi:hypothetical protein
MLIGAYSTQWGIGKGTRLQVRSTKLEVRSFRCVLSYRYSFKRPAELDIYSSSENLNRSRVCFAFWILVLGYWFLLTLSFHAGARRGSERSGYLVHRRVPCSLPTGRQACSLFLVPCSLFLVPCSVFGVRWLFLQVLSTSPVLLAH